MLKKIIIIGAIVVAVCGIVWYGYSEYKEREERRHPRFYDSNGRLEATEVYVSAKLAGRVEKIFVKEGDLVKKGDKLVQMQIDVLEAQRDIAVATLEVQKGELEMVNAHVEQRKSALDGARKAFERQKELLKTNSSSKQKYEDAETAYKTAKADLLYAEADVKTAVAKIKQKEAELKKIEVDIKDSLLIATHDGRIQYLLAREGEVLAAGGRAMNLVDLTDTYMTFFLPTNVVGQVRMGAEVRLVFDAAPEYYVDAKVTFIDPTAQFTPKSVETKVEREKMMFRLKANIDSEALRKYIQDVKTGIPGIAWVKIRPDADWNDSPIKDLKDMSTEDDNLIENQKKKATKVGK